MLPNLVVALLQVSAFIVVLLVIPETNPRLAGQRHLDLQIGRRIRGLMGWRASGETVQYAPLKREQEPTVSAPVQIHDDGDDGDESEHELQVMATRKQQLESDADPKPRGAFTQQVILQILSVSLLAFHKVSSDAIMPTFLAAPATPSDPQPTRRNLLETTGGFGYGNQKVGMILLSQAIVGLITQATIVPYFIDMVGSLKAYRLVLGAYPAMYIFTPILPKLPHTMSLVLVAFDLWIKVILSSIGYHCSAVL